MERSKKYKASAKKIKGRKLYSIEEAVKLVKGASYASFGGSIEVKVNLGIDPKDNEQNVRFISSLPHPTGRQRTVLAFTEKDIKSSSYNTLEVIKGDEEAIAKIQSGKLAPGNDFSFVITEPKFMPQVAKIAKVLGPRGMMPSPKTDTVGDVESILSNLDKGQVELRAQPGNRVVHLILGKVDSEDKNIVENFKTVIEELNKHKPNKVKKTFIESAYLKATMSPSVKVSLIESTSEEK